MDSVGYQVVLVILFAIYMLPAIIAGRKSHKNCHAICVLNVLTGWTFIGWVGALVWAMTNGTQPASEVDKMRELIKEMQALQGEKK